MEKDIVILADYNKEKGPLNTMFKKCIGAGRANEGLRADWQDQLRLVQKECGFEYIRMHGLLCDDMGVYREDEKGNPEYNFQYIDVLFDFLLSINIKPFVELGFMPEALASGRETIFWWKGNVTPPKDYNKWQDLITALIIHFTKRYSEEEVRSWYFEVWNEPNLSGFWASTKEEYFKLYKYTAFAIKGVCPYYKTGGPATAGAAWVPEMIEFCVQNEVPIDFISTHTYGVKEGYLDEFGSAGTVLDPDELSVARDIRKSKQEIENSLLPHLELHYTEWSSSYTPRDPLHDSYVEAAFILEKIKQSENFANSMSYWVFTDIFEEAGPRFTPFHGGFGLLNYQGIKKAAFCAYEYLNKLGNIELETNVERAYICKDRDGAIQVLCWNFTNIHPGEVNNQDFFNQDLPSSIAGSVTLTLTSLVHSAYRLQICKTGYDKRDPYTEYIRMGSPHQLSVEEVGLLKRKAVCLPEEKNIPVKDGKISISFNMNENDVFLCIFSPVTKG
jgi:xylan 1,4-beta-xylosidase